jgi:DNA-directed RNA polymerase sigma subunit (sigma70/sigma32)
MGTQDQTIKALQQQLNEQDKKVDSLTKLIRFLISQPRTPERNMPIEELAQLLKDVGTVNPTPDTATKSIYESTIDYLQRLTPEQRRKAFSRTLGNDLTPKPTNG